MASGENRRPGEPRRNRDLHQRFGLT